MHATLTPKRLSCSAPTALSRGAHPPPHPEAPVVGHPCLAGARPAAWLPLLAAAGSVAAALLLTVSSPEARAQTPAEQRIDQRQDRQEQRIEQGVKSGELTRREARRLQRQQAGVARAEARAESDGQLSAREAARIERRQDRTSARIYRQKHDRQERPN